MSASFRYTQTIDVHFRDCDPLGHVNNAVQQTIPVPDAFRARAERFEGVTFARFTPQSVS